MATALAVACGPRTCNWLRRFCSTGTTCWLAATKCGQARRRRRQRPLQRRRRRRAAPIEKPVKQSAPPRRSSSSSANLRNCRTLAAAQSTCRYRRPQPRPVEMPTRLLSHFCTLFSSTMRNTKPTSTIRVSSTTQSGPMRSLQPQSCTNNSNNKPFITRALFLAVRTCIEVSNEVKRHWQ